MKKDKFCLKVLPNDFECRSFEWSDFDVTEGMIPTPSVFNRSGIYYDGKQCWIEFKDGRAFLYNADSFKHSLNLFMASELNSSQKMSVINAYETLPKTFINKRLKRMYYLIRDYEANRNIYRGARLHFNKVF